MKSQMRLILLIAGSLAFCGVLAAGYFFLVAPYFARVKVVEKAEREASDAQRDLEDLQLQTKRLKELTRRSLPAGPEYKDDAKRMKREYADVARSEYEQALTKILKDAGARNSTINFSDAESTNKAGVPLILPNDPKGKPGRDDDPADFYTYTQLVFKIDIPKTDLETVADILKRYYSLDVLHQISHLNIKQTGPGELGEDKRPQKERSDLKVEITTRAIIVHGADRRRTLTPAPSTLVGVLGGLGGAAFENSPNLARKVLPEPLEPILASAPFREYKYMAAKDVYHGTLPIPERPKDVVKVTDIVEPPPPPKPDFREFIWFTTSIHTIEGDAHTLDITIKDKINKEDYNLLITQAGEKVLVKVYKWEYDNFKVDVSSRRKKTYSQETLEISKYTMLNKNNFTVYGVDDLDGSLILGEKPSGLAPELPKDDKKPVVGAPGGFGGARPSTKPTLPPADPRAAVIGGMVVTAPKPEKFYRWEYGKNLKQIVELSKPEADAAIKRAQSRFLPKATSATPVPPVAVTPPVDAKKTDKP